MSQAVVWACKVQARTRNTEPPRVIAQLSSASSPGAAAPVWA